MKQHTKHKKDIIIGRAKIDIDTIHREHVDDDFWIKLYPVDSEIASGASLLVKWNKEIDQLDHQIISFQPIAAQEIPRGEIYVQVTYETLTWKSGLGALPTQKKRKNLAAVTWSNEKTSFLVLNPAMTQSVSPIHVEVWRQAEVPESLPKDEKRIYVPIKKFELEFLGQFIVNPNDILIENNNKEIWYDLREREQVVDANTKAVGEIRIG